MTRRASEYDPVHTGEIFTTERTSKRLKLQLALSVLAAIAGVLMTVTSLGNEPAASPRPDVPMVPKLNVPFLVGVPMAAVGILWFVVTKIRIWWRHG